MAFGSITLCAGEAVKFSELPLLIARALHGDSDDMTLALARVALEEELPAIVQRGGLVVRDALTLGVQTFPIGNALADSILTADDLRPFLLARGIELRIGKTPDVTKLTPRVDDWKARARKRALEIFSDYKASDSYPSQNTVADRIAEEFRASGVMGADGKPLTGATIKRHALKGVASPKHSERGKGK